MTVGVVGLGNMGTPMARRIAAADIPVLGFDPSPGARSAAGVPVTEHLAEVARTCETVVLSLPSSDVVDVVVADLLATADAAVRVIVDTSSSVPARTQALAATAERTGVRLIDAPVSGGVPRAVDGTLTIMVGGDEAAIAAVRPVLEAIGSAVHAVGPVGAGHALKALNNLLSAAHLITSCEALLTAEAFGIDPTVFVDVVNSSSGRSGSTELKLPRYVIPRTWASGFSAALLAKDALIAAQLEDAAGLHDSLGAAVAARWSELTERLPVGADHTEIIRPLEIARDGGDAEPEGTQRKGTDD
jgi:3-hydroxyisobutyrate dehydrogenase